MLVDVIDDVEPNLPPVLTADTGTVVVGSSVSIDVLANDIDPDGDPLMIIGVTQPDDGLGQVVCSSDQGPVHPRLGRAIATRPTLASPTPSATATATR